MVYLKKVRVAAGSAAVLGLNTLKLEVPPTTAYLMLYHEGKCSANCSFCPQARGSTGKASHLSRVSWPVFPVADLVEKLNIAFHAKRLFRCCIQTLNYPEGFGDLMSLIQSIESTGVPISVAVHPLSSNQFRQLKEHGVDRVGIALDGCTQEIFDGVKGSIVGGPYIWADHLHSIRSAVGIFGTKKVATHFIIGLGETEREVLEVLQAVHDIEVSPSLFAFTPIRGTLEAKRQQPEMLKYRKMQLGRELIINRGRRVNEFSFSPQGDLVSFNLEENDFCGILNPGKPFQTQGCPACNRPNYTSRPGKTPYNYPQKLTREQIEEIRRLVEPFR